MKKLTAFILTTIMLLSSISANAQTLDFLKKVYTNYTQEGTMSITFDSSEDIVALFEELEMPEEVERYIDLKALLKSLLSLDSTMTLQADMSDDYRKMQFALVSDSQQSIDVNKNLNIGIKSKTGMWMNIDLNAEDPVYEVIYSHPILNKYMYINFFEMAPDEHEKLKMITAMKVIFNKDFLEPIIDFSAKLVEKHWDIKTLRDSYIMKLDNDSLIAMTEDLMAYIKNKTDLIKSLASVYDAEEVLAMDWDFPSLKGSQLLGKDGITCKYNLVAGNLSKAEMTADISVDISKIVTEVIGTEWPYESKGLLDFTITNNTQLSNRGTTKVDFPELTEENSFDIMADMQYEPVDGEYIYEPTYPHFYAYSYVDRLPMVNDEIYVPLRQTITSAYDDTADIQYDNGIITISCEHFPEFKTLKLAVNSDVVYTDETSHTISKVLVYDDISYVSSDLFEDIFGWQLSYISHNLLDDTFDYGFDTMPY